jgi:hypothetical protein
MQRIAHPFVRVALASALAFAIAAPLTADVKTTERGVVKFSGTLGRVVGLFGGRAAREGVVWTVSVSGNRKARLNDQNGEIVDLAEEKIYDLDVRRKTYTVTTFAELRQRLAEARATAEAEAAKIDPEQEAQAEQASREMEVDFDVRETGERKSVNGFDTRQVIATVTVREKGRTLEEGGGLVLTSDMWLAPTVAALREIQDFDRRYFEQIAGPVIGDPQQMAAALAMYPFLKDAISRLEQEKGRTDGTPIVTSVTIDSVKSQEQMAARSGDASGAPSGVGGLVGGLGRRLARRNTEQTARATFMTSTNEMLTVSTDVAAADVAIPAGFTQRN